MPDFSVSDQQVRNKSAAPFKTIHDRSPVFDVGQKSSVRYFDMSDGNGRTMRLYVAKIGAKKPVFSHELTEITREISNRIAQDMVIERENGRKEAIAEQEYLRRFNLVMRYFGLIVLAALLLYFALLGSGTLGTFQSGVPNYLLALSVLTILSFLFGPHAKWAWQRLREMAGFPTAY